MTAVIKNQLGPNTFEFVTDIGASVTTTTLLTTHIHNEIINGHGWSVHDYYGGYYIYKALNKDGLTYKYVKIDGDISLNVYESWDSTSHAGTNVCYYYPQETMGFSGGPNIPTESRIYLFVSPRYLAIYSPVQDMIGCFEISRENPTDSGSSPYPCFARTNMYYIANPSSYYTGMFSVPRTKTGYTSTSAFSYNCLMTSYGKIGYNVGNLAQLYSDIVPSSKNYFTGKHNVLSIYPYVNIDSDLRGRFYGLKFFTTGYGLARDITKVKVDNDGLCDSAGTLSDHMIMSIPNSFLRMLLPL